MDSTELTILPFASDDALLFSIPHRFQKCFQKNPGGQDPDKIIHNRLLLSGEVGSPHWSFHVFQRASWNDS